MVCVVAIIILEELGFCVGFCVLCQFLLFFLIGVYIARVCFWSYFSKTVSFFVILDALLLGFAWLW